MLAAGIVKRNVRPKSGLPARCSGSPRRFLTAGIVASRIIASDGAAGDRPGKPGFPPDSVGLSVSEGGVTSTGVQINWKGAAWPPRLPEGLRPSGAGDLPMGLDPRSKNRVVGANLCAPSSASLCALCGEAESARKSLPPKLDLILP